MDLSNTLHNVDVIRSRLTRRKCNVIEDEEPGVLISVIMSPCLKVLSSGTLLQEMGLTVECVRDLAVPKGVSLVYRRVKIMRSCTSKGLVGGIENGTEAAGGEGDFRSCYMLDINGRV